MASSFTPPPSALDLDDLTETYYTATSQVQRDAAGTNIVRFFAEAAGMPRSSVPAGSDPLTFLPSASFLPYLTRGLTTSSSTSSTSPTSLSPFTAILCASLATLCVDQHWPEIEAEDAIALLDRIVETTARLAASDEAQGRGGVTRAAVVSLCRCISRIIILGFSDARFQDIAKLLISMVSLRELPTPLITSSLGPVEAAVEACELLTLDFTKPHPFITESPAIRELIYMEIIMRPMAYNLVGLLQDSYAAIGSTLAQVRAGEGGGGGVGPLPAPSSADFGRLLSLSRKALGLLELIYPGWGESGVARGSSHAEDEEEEEAGAHNGSRGSSLAEGIAADITILPVPASWPLPTCRPALITLFAHMRLHFALHQSLIEASGGASSSASSTSPSPLYTFLSPHLPAIYEGMTASLRACSTACSCLFTTDRWDPSELRMVLYMRQTSFALSYCKAATDAASGGDFPGLAEAGVLHEVARLVARGKTTSSLTRMMSSPRLFAEYALSFANLTWTVLDRRYRKLVSRATLNYVLAGWVYLLTPSSILPQFLPGPALLRSIIRPLWRTCLERFPPMVHFGQGAEADEDEEEADEEDEESGGSSGGGTGFSETAMEPGSADTISLIAEVMKFDFKEAVNALEYSIRFSTQVLRSTGDTNPRACSALQRDLAWHVRAGMHLVLASLAPQNGSIGGGEAWLSLGALPPRSATSTSSSSSSLAGPSSLSPEAIGNEAAQLSYAFLARASDWCNNPGDPSLAPFTQEGSAAAAFGVDGQELAMGRRGGRGGGWGKKAALREDKQRKSLLRTGTGTGTGAAAAGGGGDLGMGLGGDDDDADNAAAGGGGGGGGGVGGEDGRELADDDDALDAILRRFLDSARGGGGADEEDEGYSDSDNSVGGNGDGSGPLLLEEMVGEALVKVLLEGSISLEKVTALEGQVNAEVTATSSSSTPPAYDPAWSLLPEVVGLLALPLVDLSAPFNVANLPGATNLPSPSFAFAPQLLIREEVAEGVDRMLAKAAELIQPEADCAPLIVTIYKLILFLRSCTAAAAAELRATPAAAGGGGTGTGGGGGAVETEDSLLNDIDDVGAQLMNSLSLTEDEQASGIASMPFARRFGASSAAAGAAKSTALLPLSAAVGRGHGQGEAPLSYSSLLVWSRSRCALELSLLNFISYFHTLYCVYRGEAEQVAKMMATADEALSRAERPAQPPPPPSSSSQAQGSSFSAMPGDATHYVFLDGQLIPLSGTAGSLEESAAAAAYLFGGGDPSSLRSSSLSSSSSAPNISASAARAIRASAEAKAQRNILLQVIPLLGAQHPYELLDVLVAKTLDNLRLQPEVPTNIVVTSLRALHELAVGITRVHRRRGRYDVTESIMAGDDLLRTICVRTLLRTPVGLHFPPLRQPRHLRFRSALFSTLTRLLFLHAKAITAPARALVDEAKATRKEAVAAEMASDASAKKKQLLQQRSGGAATGSSSSSSGSTPLRGLSGAVARATTKDVSITESGVGDQASDEVEDDPAASLYLFSPEGGAAGWFAAFVSPLTSSIANAREALTLPPRPLGPYTAAPGRRDGVDAPTISSTHPSLTSLNSKVPLIALLRDLRGVIAAASAAFEYQIVHEWMVSVGAHGLFYRIATCFRGPLHYDVTVPLLRLLVEYATNRQRRIMFPPGNVGGYIVFREIASTLVAIATHAVVSSTPSRAVAAGSKGSEDASRKVAQLVLHCGHRLLTSHTSNTGAMAVFGDTVASDVWHTLVQTTLTIPISEALARHKLATALMLGAAAAVNSPLPPLLTRVTLGGGSSGSSNATATASTAGTTSSAVVVRRSIVQQGDGLSCRCAPAPETVAALMRLPSPLFIAFVARLIVCISSTNKGVRAASATALSAVESILCVEAEARLLVSTPFPQGRGEPPPHQLLPLPSGLRMTFNEAKDIVRRMNAHAAAPLTFAGVSAAGDETAQIVAAVAAGAAADVEEGGWAGGGAEDGPSSKGLFGISFIAQALFAAVRASAKPSTENLVRVILLARIVFLNAICRPGSFEAACRGLSSSCSNTARGEQVDMACRDLVEAALSIQAPTSEDGMEEWSAGFVEWARELQGAF